MFPPDNYDWNQIVLSVFFFCKSSPWGNKKKTPEGWDHDPPSVAERLSFPSLSSCTLMTIMRLKKIKANECFSVTGADGTLAAMLFSHWGGCIKNSQSAEAFRRIDWLINYSPACLKWLIWGNWLTRCSLKINPGLCRGGGCRFSLRRFQRLLAPFVHFQVYLDSALHIRIDGGELKEAKQNKRSH